jgi:asparagine synthase (glutamine-hydrolysing)
MQGRMPEDIRMNRRKIGFNSPMPEWLNGPLAGWTESLLNQNVPAFSEFVDEARLVRKVGQLNATKGWDWQSVGAIWPYLNMKWLLSRNV